MDFIRKHKIAIGAVLAVLAVAAFLAFRPDKLFVDDAVDESLAQAFATTTTVPVTDTVEDPATSSIPETTTSNPETTTTTVAPPSGPVAIATGGFYGIDHTASGTATIYEQDGAYVLRFEDDTDIQNGPDLYVWVLPAGDFDGSDPVEYIDLGKLKGNVGGQNYQLPPEFDPEIHQSVLIWCLRFGVPFAAVPLS